MKPPDLERELDRHGASLHALALALLGNDADAADAVQDTWVRVLRRPPAKSGPLGGWLHTILHNTASKLRRGRARRLRREQQAARPELQPSAHALLAQRETLRAVVDALFALPEPLCRTLWLRFFEHQKPAAIAAQTGEPLATVKSRLQRGLVLLRQRLDGDKGDWRGALAGAFGLERASALAGGAALGTGVLLMGTGVKLAIGGAAAVVAVAATLFFAGGPPEAGSATPGAGGIVAAATGAAATGSTGGEVPPSAAPPAPLDRQLASPSGSGEAGLAHLRGRCVAAEDQTPIAGCKARLGGSSREVSDAATLEGRRPWHPPDPVITGQDGRFDFAFATVPFQNCDLQLSAPSRVVRLGRWSRVAPGQVIELGDVPLTKGFDVSGRVVDAQGAPVASVDVRLCTNASSSSSGMEPDGVSSYSGRSRPDGAFQVWSPVPAGSWTLDLGGQGHFLVGPDHVVIDPMQGLAPLVVTVARTPTIAGKVVDERGDPLEGISIGVEIAAGWRGGRSPNATSLADGTFLLRAVEPEPKAVKLQVDDSGPCEPSWRDDRVHEWGETDVRIVLQRALSFELTVVERGTGVPITEYGVSCFGEKGAGSSQYYDLRLAGRHQDGRVVVDRVWRGANFLTVRPVDATIAPSGTIEFQASEAGVPPMRVELDRMQPATVRVLTAAGAPVIGSRVEVIALGTGELHVDDGIRDPETQSNVTSSDPRYRVPELRSSGRTGPDGRAQVLVPPPRRPLAVRVTGGHPRVLLSPATITAGEELLVTVPASGGITGTVQFAGLDPQRASVYVHRLEGNQATIVRLPTGSGQLAADGRFALHGLVPGRYRVGLSYEVTYTTESGGIGGWNYDVPPTEVVVDAGRDSQVALDATVCSPASLRGRVRLDGAAPGSARVFAWNESGGRVGQFIVEADGSFVAPEILPGTYRLVLVVGNFMAGAGDEIPSDDTFAVAAKEQLARDFAFTRRKLTVCLLRADGTPEPSLPVFCGNALHFGPRTADADGCLVFDPAPIGPIRIQREGAEKFVDVEMPRDQLEHAVTVTLPPVK
jgi:RNA polymerase sigma-70 factor (ECF subfamily)